jgi:DNA-binding transcriptional regulator YhcF (GntR family)
VRLRVDPNNGEPLGLQIARQLRLAAASGRIGPGERLPSARELAAQLSVNFHTVRAAYGELEKDGLLLCEQGRGTFLAARPRSLGAAELRRLVRSHMERLAEDLASANADADAVGALALEELRRALGAGRAVR